MRLCSASLDRGIMMLAASGQTSLSVAKSAVFVPLRRLASNYMDVNKLEEAKKSAAYACVEEHVTSNQIIGVGSGSTAAYVVQCLAEKFKQNTLSHITCVPTSSQARFLILQSGLPLGDLDAYPNLDICIDGADEVDGDLNCIKGGGGCQTQEKLVMSASRRFYIVADFRKRSQRLGDQWKYVPLEVLWNAWLIVKMTVENKFGGHCELRMGKSKAGPMVSDNGGYVLDWYMPSRYQPVNGWQSVHESLKLIPGVIETGLFIGFAQQAYFGMQNGTVSVLRAPNDRLINSYQKLVAQ